MEKIIELVNGLNLQMIISIFAVTWYFTNDMKKDIISRIDNLDKDIREMNSRVGRLEGTVYGNEVYKNINNEKIINKGD